MFEFSSGAFDFSSVTYLQECDMSKSKLQKHQQPLTTLQSMINGVLIQTGKVLREANQKGPKTIGHTHAGLQAALPVFIESFHLALDELEIDIVRAKAVLGRDLRELQLRRSQLDNPSLQHAEASGSLADEAESPAASTPRGIAVAISETNLEASEVVKNEDLTLGNLEMKIDSPSKSGHKSIPGSPSETGQIQADNQLQESIYSSIEARADEPHTDSVDFDDLRDNVNADTSHGLGISLSDVVPSATSDAPLPAALHSSTYDTSYDPGNIGESDIIFDEFGFSSDGPAHENNEFSGNGGEFDLSSFGNQANNDNDDPSSVLQDLTNYGDAGTADFDMLDMSNDAAGNLGASDDYGIGARVNDSIFDDLFEGMAYDGNDETGGTTMEHGEIDDDFFGLNTDG